MISLSVIPVVSKWGVSSNGRPSRWQRSLRRSRIWTGRSGFGWAQFWAHSRFDQFRAEHTGGCTSM